MNKRRGDTDLSWCEKEQFNTIVYKLTWLTEMGNNTAYILKLNIIPHNIGIPKNEGY